jgi:mRNA-degrading endonuclease HigB of HigAB toxin-antitoxin module
MLLNVACELFDEIGDHNVVHQISGQEIRVHVSFELHITVIT